MPAYNKVILLGNMTRDPELRFTASNTAVCEFGLAVNERHKNQAGEWEDRPQFFDVVAFGKTAENVSKYFSKGKPIFIDGSLRFESWEDKQTGERRTKVKVCCQYWQFVESKQQGSGQSNDAPPNW